MHEAAARVAGASLTAAEAVLGGRAEHAFNPSGGLHHAMPERASGFCVYDDPAIAIAWMLEHGASRIAYVDVDVHHGDGPQAIFYERPARADDLHPPGRPDALSGDGVRRGARDGRRGRHQGQRAGPAADGRRRVARRAGGDRPAARDRLEARRARDAAGLRHAHDRPARVGGPDDGCVSRGRGDAAPAGARGGRRQVGGDGRRRLPVGAGSCRARGRSTSPRWPAS